jgi:hypothetical protein
MDEDRILHEEYNSIPEHVIPPEYTPEYPDVSFFQESYVTAREENIFQGETPPGEEDLRALKKEEQQKRARFSWLRNLLGSALRGGAAIFGICALVVTLVSGAELPEDSPWTPVKNKVAELKREPMRQLDDYGPGELKQLWTGDPEGPHQYDFEHAHLRREASCEEDGIIEYYCRECGIALPEIVPGGHVPAASVRENEQQPDCIHEGGWDDIVYCSVCHGELSREHHSIPATGHTSAEAVMENVVGAVCTEGGSYDIVVYCAVCHAELSREHFTTEALGHTPAEAVTENEKAPTCTGEGSYDSVVYCSVCDAELSRETVPVAALGHHPGFAVKENEKEPSCTKEGAYDSVIYCMVCDEELSREKVTLPVIAHIETQDIEENRVDPDCVTEGSAEIAVYCDVCGQELSREAIVLEALGHTEDEPLVENETEPTCTEEGGFDEVIYCMVCGEEVSRVHTVIEATGHDWDEPTYTWSSDNNSVTATRTCRNDPSHKETETVTAGSTVTTQATCTTAGTRKYTATFSNPAFTAQTKNVTIPATGHSWGEPTYAWSSDNGKVTAARTCRNDSSHKETETVNVSSSVTKQATCTATGTRTYTASFSNSAFAKQTKTETLAALEHSYTAKTTAATCTAQGYTTHTCSRCGNSYKDSYTDALGHSYGSWTTTQAATCTATGSEQRRCSRCGNTETRTIAKLAHTAGEVKRENYVSAKCETEGGYDSVTYCSVCNSVMSSQHYSIAATGHRYDLSQGSRSVLYCTQMFDGTRCTQSALTLSYNRSSNTMTITGQPNFLDQLRNGSYECKYYAEGKATNEASGTYRLIDDSLYWTLTAGSYSTSFEPTYLTAYYTSGTTVTVTLYFTYSDSSSSRLITAPPITVTVP